MKQLYYIIDSSEHFNAVFDEDTDCGAAFDNYEAALTKAKELAQENPTSTYVVAMGWCEVAVPPAKPARVRAY